MVIRICYKNIVIRTKTDGLIQDTKINGVYKYFYKDKGKFGFSNYPNNSMMKQIRQ